MQETTNYHLKQPDYNDAADIRIINENMTTVDTALKGHDNSISSINTTLAEHAEEIGKHEVFVVTISGVTSLPVRYPAGDALNNNISSDMVCIRHEIGRPSVQGNNWTVTTYDGYFTVSGTFNGSSSTSIKLYLMKSM